MESKKDYIGLSRLGGSQFCRTALGVILSKKVLPEGGTEKFSEKKDHLPSCSGDNLEIGM